MTHLPAFALTFSLLTSSFALAQQPNPLPLEPPDLFGNRVTIVPSEGVIPTQPIIDVIQPVQQILDNLCGTVSSVGGGVSKQLAFLCTARDIVNHAVDTVEGLKRSADAAMLNAWEEAQAMHAIAISASRGFYAIGNDAPRGLTPLP